MFGEPGARSPHDVLYCYFAGGQLQAVRDRRWKLHFPHPYRTLAGRPRGRGGAPVPYSTAQIGLALFDLKRDPAETRDVAAEHPQEVRRLETLAQRARSELGDTLGGQPGAAIRPAGRLQPGDERLVW
jgi:hypothetical protein